MREKSRSILAEFRDFIMRGNVIDLAVAVILGGAFGKIVESLVKDIITPAILNPVIEASGVEKLSELSINGIQYGLFIAAVINFFVVAVCMFFIIRSFEIAKKRLTRQEKAIAAEKLDEKITAQERLIAAMERLATILEKENR